MLAGAGPERAGCKALADELEVRLVLVGDVPWERISETYVAADVFALLSQWEPWGVVVNEAAASGLPLVLSDQVGAAPDLLRDGENGVLVPAGDVAAAAAALRRYLDPALRHAAGARSREIVARLGLRAQRRLVRRRRPRGGRRRTRQASVSRMPEERKRILVLNQYYWPGVEATAQLLAQLCEALATDFDVTVVTGRLRGHPELPTEEMRDGVRIVRVSSTAYERSQFHLRAANYVTYLTDSVLAALREERPDLVLCMTDPPIVGDIGALRRAAVRRAAARHQPGRVPGDRGAAEAAREPRPRRRLARPRRRCT